MAPLTTLIITTYNRPAALAAVLRAVEGQIILPSQVLIADDGSGPETAGLIRSWQNRLPLQHIWQEDRGFRAAEARNRALVQATGELVIFLDGDCLPRPDFIARHQALAEPGYFVAGQRILLSQAFSDAVTERHIMLEKWPLMRLAAARLRGQINRFLPLLSLKGGGWRRRRGQNWKGVRTCNLAAWRSDLVAVDGFDSAFQGWGLEDSDLAIRLFNAGVQRKDGRFSVAVFHLWHREADRAALPQNRQRLEALLGERRIKAQSGLSSIKMEGRVCDDV